MSQFIKLHVFLFSFLLTAAVSQAKGFEWVTANRVLPIVITKEEPEYVQLAAQDLASDVCKITGLSPAIVSDISQISGPCVEIRTKKGGPWESYHVSMQGDRLIIEGGDARGTMFGVYAFAENYLHVDPMWFWSGIEPKKCAALKWDSVELKADTPTFKYRGWFINDEDLLTFWKPGGTRKLPYKLYNNMMHPETLNAIAEALVRSRCNLVIPASFIDIMNPAEEALVKACARRGLFLSMHHQEPLGVSAWVYFNYWKSRGKDLKYSYVSQAAEVREVWRVYAKKWAEYPNVIWQLGLRGKGDRPMWQADPDTPQSDKDRGKIISDAMADQVKILKQVCSGKPLIMSTTLWAEGAVLNQKGLLAVPDDVIIVFADNSPGWKWQQDFYKTQRCPKNTYGVYYHHALIGSGPHLAQAIPPHKTFSLLQEAVNKGADEYAIFNVSNVREFVLGIDATAKMTWDMKAFNSDAWLENWISNRFSTKHNEIANAYKIAFNAYQVHEIQKVPFLLDGLLINKGRSSLNRITECINNKRIGKGTEKEKAKGGSAVANKAQSKDAFWASLSDMSPRKLGRRETIKRVAVQKQGFDLALLHARVAKENLSAQEALFLQDNLIYQMELMSRLSGWFKQLLIAEEALGLGNIPSGVKALESAEKELAPTEALIADYCHGKWENWYNGCVILNVPARLKQTREVLAKLSKSQ
ncbi:MAG: glycosyl hydrolase 115 family protein [Kiritimatiellae bacterium]|jgi:hypothetical protein|nr:glycosyl hydrolase 115 family protein [Kiritimatiellia bacterium]